MADRDPTKVVTLDDIVGATSEMRLTLTKKFETLTDPKPSDSKESDSDDVEAEKKAIETLVKIWSKKVEAGLVETKEEIKDIPNLDEKAQQEAVQKNIEKVKAVTQETMQHLLRVEETVIDEMKKLPIEDQPQVIAFWGSAHSFFGGVMDWLSNMFKFVLEKIRQGCRIVKNAFTGLFDTVCRFLGNMFKSKEQIETERKEREQKEREQKEREQKEREQKEREQKERA